MSKLRCEFVRRGWGIKVGFGGDERWLNLRFVDDVMLVSSSLRVLRKELQEMREEVRKVGVELRLRKPCYYLTGSAGSSTQRAPST